METTEKIISCVFSYCIKTLLNIGKILTGYVFLICVKILYFMNNY